MHRRSLPTIATAGKIATTQEVSGSQTFANDHRTAAGEIGLRRLWQSFI
jgi:hypothetical protein